MLNAFTMVRPRGPDLDIPAAPQRKTNASKAPAKGNVHFALDRNGRRTVGLGPRTTGAITAGSREPSAATLDKARRAKKGGAQC